jgi:hypothetical protein
MLSPKINWISPGKSYYDPVHAMLNNKTVIQLPLLLAALCGSGTAFAQDGPRTTRAMVAHAGALKFLQEASGLHVTMPEEKPCDYAFALEITGLER